MKVAIVGGGFMGLTLAHKLSRINVVAKVIERDGQVGGLATYHNYGKFYWDRFYHVILPTDEYLIDLIEELGLGSELCWQRTYTGYYEKGNFYSVSNLKEFLLFPPLNIIDKIRLAITLYYGSKINNWKRLETISVVDWLIKIGGKKTFQKFWKPLLLAKLGDNYSKVSAVFIWTYIKRLFHARDASSRKEHMGYVKGGYKTILERMTDNIQARGSEIILNADVKSIVADPAGGLMINYNGKVEHFDKVIFTAPLKVLKKVASANLYELSKGEKEVEYLGVICMVLITRKPVSPYYVLNISDNQIPFTGVIGMSSLVDLDQTSGEFLTYFPKYITSDDPIWSKTEDELKQLFIKGAKLLYPQLSDNDIVSIHINKAMKVQPLQVIDYSKTIPEIQTNHPDFYVLNTSQFVNDTLNNNTVTKHVSRFMEKFQSVVDSVLV